MLKTILFSLFALAFFSAVSSASNAYNEALSAYSRGNFKKAVSVLEKYVDENPRAEAYYLLGYSYYKMKRHREAARYFGEAYLIDPALDPAKIIREKGK
jgi:TolA-binding protein